MRSRYGCGVLRLRECRVPRSTGMPRYWLTARHASPGMPRRGCRAAGPGAPRGTGVPSATGRCPASHPPSAGRVAHRHRAWWCLDPGHDETHATGRGSASRSAVGHRPRPPWSARPHVTADVARSGPGREVRHPVRLVRGDRQRAWPSDLGLCGVPACPGGAATKLDVHGWHHLCGHSTPGVQPREVACSDERRGVRTKDRLGSTADRPAEEEARTPHRAATPHRAPHSPPSAALRTERPIPTERRTPHRATRLPGGTGHARPDAVPCRVRPDDPRLTVSGGQSTISVR